MSGRDTNKILEIAVSPNKMFKDFWDLEKSVFENSANKRLPVKFVFDKTDIIIVKPFNYEEEFADMTLKHFILSCFDNKTAEFILNKCKIVINSSEFELNVPMIFLVLNFCYIDLFLYITILEN